MNAKHILRLIAVALIGTVLLPSAPSVRGEEEATIKYTVIRLLADRIEPAHARIKQGTVIIWVNEAQETADIQFADREMAARLNGTPHAGNRIQQGMSFKIEFGKTESICLVQKGIFSYSITRGSKSIPGTIEVR